MIALNLAMNATSAARAEPSRRLRRLLRGVRGLCGAGADVPAGAWSGAGACSGAETHVLLDSIWLECGRGGGGSGSVLEGSSARGARNFTASAPDWCMT